MIFFFPGTVHNRSEITLMEHINEKNIPRSQDLVLILRGKKNHTHNRLQDHKGKMWWAGEVLEKLLSWVREIPVSLWSFRNKKHLLHRASVWGKLRSDLHDWLAQPQVFPGRVSPHCCRAWQWAAEHSPVGSKEMMVEARNDCYFSPADRYTLLAEMIQHFKVESCETLWVTHGEHRTQEGQLPWNTSGMALFPSALNLRLRCACRLFFFFLLTANPTPKVPWRFIIECSRKQQVKFFKCWVGGQGKDRRGRKVFHLSHSCLRYYH